MESGETIVLPEVKVPPKFEGFGDVIDVDRLKHYNQPFGQEARKNSDPYDSINSINPAAFVTDDEEKKHSIRFWTVCSR